MCTEPLFATRVKDEFNEIYKHTGKRGAIRVLKAVRDFPNMSYDEIAKKLYVDLERFNLFMIPCGQCVHCRMTRTASKAVQLTCESLSYEHNYFLTLTFGYQDCYNYYKSKNYSRYMCRKLASFLEWSLEKKLFQDFMKRLRFRYSEWEKKRWCIEHGLTQYIIGNRVKLPKCINFVSSKLKFYHCGEYGSKNGRPHHHCIIYNLNPEFLGRIETISRCGKISYESPVIKDLWKFGFTDIRDCCYDTCKYVCGYVLKKSYGISSDEYYQGRMPDYSTSSNRTALGSAYLSKNYNEIINNNSITLKVNNKLVSFPIPQAFLRLLNRDYHFLTREFFHKRFEDNQQKLIDAVNNTKRSFYSALDDKEKRSLSILQDKKRQLESLLGTYTSDELLEKKVKSFGFNYVNDFVLDYVKGRSYRNYLPNRKKGSLYDNYIKFENFRKSKINSISNFYNPNLSLEENKRIRNVNLSFIKRLTNPYKCDNITSLIDSSEFSESSCKSIVGTKEYIFYDVKSKTIY